MKAKVVRDYISLYNYFHFEGVWFGEARCNDYDGFRSLPEVIEVNGRKLGKSGWNSDQCIAYYRDDKVLGKVMK